MENEDKTNGFWVLIAVFAIVWIYNQLQEYWKWSSGRRSSYSWSIPRRFIPTGYCRPMQKCIEDLAQDLSPPREYLRAGKTVARNIFQLLKTHAPRHNIKIARTHIAGSIGKGTAIWYTKVDGGKTNKPDFDLVVLINDQRPPFDHVLRALECILKKDPRISILGTTNKTVQFLYQHNTFGEMKFDLLPATNYVRQLDNRTSVGEAQARLALEHLTLEHRERLRNDDVVDFELNKLYSSGFNESTVQIINDYVRDEFIRKVVRLAKFWIANLNFGKPYFPARSSIIELIAIHAQQDPQTGRICLISAFRRFLEQMEDFENLSVSVEHGIKNKNNPNSVIRLIRENSTGPLIIEPTNYFNNLAEGISPKVAKMLKRQAKKTLDILKELRSHDGYEEVTDPVKEIFGQKNDTFTERVLGLIRVCFVFLFKKCKQYILHLI